MSLLSDPQRLRAVDRARELWRERAQVIAQLAAQMLGAEIAQVNLVTGDVVEPLASSAEPLTVPTGQSYCQHVLGSARAVVVYDSLTDGRVRDLPHSGAVRCYLGIPLRLDGQVTGVLCVAGRSPRPWTEAEVGLLTEIATSLADEGC